MSRTVARSVSEVARFEQFGHNEVDRGDPTMSEGIDLEPAVRDVLAESSARLERLNRAVPQIRAVLEGETDAVALEATLACLLWEALPQTNWCGFYRRVGATSLAVGPYHGNMGCLRIEFTRGVCGVAARTKTTQRVADVHAFAGHITCDDRTRSELVIPVVARGELRAVLDLDSPFVDAFSADEATVLEALVAEVFDRSDVVW
jgi:L-methionine (R)-S-oxide reductase